jgi:hypothetical protein
MEGARIAHRKGVEESADGWWGNPALGAHARYAAAEQLPAKPFKENPNMKKLLQLAMLSTASLALTSYALAQQPKQPEELGDQDPLVQAVRNATQQYQNAPPKGYTAALGCVSGSDHGAMGVHFVNGEFNGETLSNGQLDPTRPQALIYEPQSNGEMKLVAVEFIIYASALPAGAPPPEVDGHLMLYIDGPSTARPDASPNRYGLPGFYELHVWAWRDNPQGPFVDWNNHVSCALQSPPQ